MSLRTHTGAETAGTAVAVEGVEMTYGSGEDAVRAVDGVSFEVEAGSVLGLLGPNGAGKTTLMKCALGLLVPTAGDVRVGGVDVHGDTRRAYRQVGAVLEGARNAYWRLTVRENVRFFAALQGIDPRERRTAHADLLDSLGLAGEADTVVEDLSRRTRAKAALACVLARETPVVFLDEPTLGLDLEASYGLRQRIRRLAEEEGRTVVLSSHDMDTVQEVCDRVVVMSDGRVVADGAVEELAGSFPTRAYRVVVRGLEQSQRRALERAHGVERWDDTPQGLRFEVTIEGSGAFYDLVDRLQRADAELVSVSTVEPDLEDAFLRLTERGAAP